MTSSPVLTECQGSAFQITFARPESLNAINTALASAFLVAVKEAVATPGVRVIVLRGDGRSFMAGGDIAQFSEAPDSIPECLIEPMNTALLLLNETPALVLGCLHGPVAGAGMSLALCCDLVIAADNTRLSFAYHKLGAAGDLGISWNLPRLIGMRKALDIALLRGSIEADEALRLGLVNRVVPTERIEAEMEEVIQRLVQIPDGAREQIKRLFHQSAQTSLADQLEAEKAAFAQSINSDEFKSAVKQFLQKKTG